MEKLKVSLAVAATVLTVGVMALPADHRQTQRVVPAWAADGRAVLENGDVRPLLPPGADELEAAGLLEWLMQILPVHPDCISLSKDAPPCEDGQPVHDSIAATTGEPRHGPERDFSVGDRAAFGDAASLRLETGAELDGTEVAGLVKVIKKVLKWVSGGEAAQEVYDLVTEYGGPVCGTSAADPCA